MKKRELEKRIKTAKRELERAEADLAEALRSLQKTPRAEKTTISAFLQAAFAKVKAGRSAILELETLLRTDA
jgi:hypothetical protein